MTGHPRIVTQTVLAITETAGFSGADGATITDPKIPRA